jgi:hypothetical protein
MSRKTLPIQEVNDILIGLGVSLSTQEFLREVNSELSFLDIKLQTGKDPVVGQSILCMVHVILRDQLCFGRNCPGRDEPITD